MLFDIHSENRISYKMLTDADLRRGTSHQSHIGLSNSSLTFMPDGKTEYKAMLIYKEFCDIAPCEVGRISREDGSNNSPNIKAGGTGKKNSNNVCRTIREYAKQSPNAKFFLIWFGLDSGTPVFWLIEEGSEDYCALNAYCAFDKLSEYNPNLGPNATYNKIVTIDSSSIVFVSIIDYARKRLENVTINLQKELEIAAEMEEDTPKFKDAEINKAKSFIRELGRKGEAMVDEYLDKEKYRGAVDAYEWVNGSSEKGKPYDFWIKYSSGLEQWVDVKTTEHEFDQRIIVSKNEIRFVTEKQNSEYAIFRVYSTEETTAKLKICSECLKYMKKLWRDVDYMTQTLSDYKASLMNYKIAFEPSPMSFGSISNELLLGRS